MCLHDILEYDLLALLLYYIILSNILCIAL
jgi:hypothetical protein